MVFFIYTNIFSIFWTLFCHSFWYHGVDVQFGMDFIFLLMGVNNDTVNLSSVIRITCAEYTNLQTRSWSSITARINQPHSKDKRQVWQLHPYATLRWPGSFCNDVSPHPLRIRPWTHQTENFPQPMCPQNLPRSCNIRKDVKYSQAQTKLPSQKCQATVTSWKCFMSWHLGFTVTLEQFKRSNLFCGLMHLGTKVRRI